MNVDQLKKRIVELEDSARQVHEMKVTISNFSEKLKNKDLIIFKLNQEIKNAKDQAKSKDDDQTRVNGILKEGEKLKHEIRELQKIIIDLQAELKSARASRRRPSVEAVEPNPFDLLYISKISEEQERSQGLEKQVRRLQEEIVVKSAVMEEMRRMVGSTTRDFVPLVEELTRENIRLQEKLHKAGF